MCTRRATTTNCTRGLGQVCISGLWTIQSILTSTTDGSGQLILMNIHEMKMALLIDQFEQDEEGRKEAEAGHR